MASYEQNQTLLSVDPQGWCSNTQAGEIPLQIELESTKCTRDIVVAIFRRSVARKLHVITGQDTGIRKGNSSLVTVLSTLCFSAVGIRDPATRTTTKRYAATIIMVT